MVRLALEDLDAFWSEQLPELYGVPFEPPAQLYPYGPDTEPPPCGVRPLDYADVAENALYCPQEDIIAWDRVALIPELQDEFGSLTVGVVMAHEYAHAIQSRAGVRGEMVTLELQADCFAGSWVADVSGRIDAFGATGEELDDAIGGFLELRDSLGVGAADPQAHGSGFDRVSAFQEGFEGGPAPCTTYDAEPPQVVAIPFASVTDLEQGGNLPIGELLDPLVTDLESFYADLFADLDRRWDPIEEIEAVTPGDDEVSCGDDDLAAEELISASFYCVADDTVYYDDSELAPTLADIGDFAFGGELARLYANAAQHQLDLFDVTDDDHDERLHADCLTGVYAAAQFAGEIPEQELVLSPGDLDEIMIAFLTIGDGADTSAFERTAAFRAGFVDDFTGCDEYL
ncbi:MAG: neutral zinc metallopeptidase [Acidimicrobiales bacterium]|nr:neutral zinc metallopeptidase [Acidimicrobiales bacterium]